MKRNFDVQRFMREYHRLVEKTLKHVSPDRVCIHSVLPVVSRPNVSNQDVGAANEQLKRYAAGQGVCFINLAERFVDSQRKVIVDYYHSDGTHLSAEGYRVWLEVIEPYIRAGAAGISSQYLGSVVTT